MKSLARLSQAAIWCVAASIALRSIFGGSDLPMTIWWFVLFVAAGGLAASYFGYGYVYNLICVILFCIAVMTMEHWLGLFMPRP